jgi:hypothetical protein
VNFDDLSDQSHPCEQLGCEHIVPYDDEPYCFDHSSDSGSYVRGYSYRAAHPDYLSSQPTKPGETK